MPLTLMRSSRLVDPSPASDAGDEVQALIAEGSITTARARQKSSKGELQPLRMRQKVDHSCASVWSRSSDNRLTPLDRRD